MSTQTFNGWANYETWNVTLWIQNDESLYNLACDVVRDGGAYGNFVNILRDTFGATHTPDNVAWDDANIDGIEVNDVMADMYEGC